jgi:hypothetical protein
LVECADAPCCPIPFAVIGEHSPHSGSRF